MQENEENQETLDDSNEEDETSPKVYELGFLIIPSMAEEKLPELVSNIKGEAEKAGSIFISEEYPKLKSLSYTMFRTVDHKKQGFDQAYFGWFKFEAYSARIKELKESLEKNLNILRFLLINTVRENTIYSHKIIPKKSKYIKRAPDQHTEVKSSVEEIDKSIEDLVAKS